MAMGKKEYIYRLSPPDETFHRIQTTTTSFRHVRTHIPNAMLRSLSRDSPPKAVGHVVVDSALSRVYRKPDRGSG